MNEKLQRWLENHPLPTTPVSSDIKSTKENAK